MAQLRKDAEQFPERLKAEVDRAAAEATRQTEARFEQRIAGLQKDAEVEKRMTEAKKSVQDIAVKAIEGASIRRSTDHPRGDG